MGERGSQNSRVRERREAKGRRANKKESQKTTQKRHNTMTIKGQHSQHLLSNELFFILLRLLMIIRISSLASTRKRGKKNDFEHRQKSKTNKHTDMQCAKLS